MKVFSAESIEFNDVFLALKRLRRGNSKFYLKKLKEYSSEKLESEQPMLVAKVFGGLLESTVVCCECDTKSTTTEKFFDLSLPIEPPEHSMTKAKKSKGKYSAKPDADGFYPAKSKKLSKRQKRARRKLAKKESQERKVTKTSITLSDIDLNESFDSDVSTTVSTGGDSIETDKHSTNPEEGGTKSDSKDTSDINGDAVTEADSTGPEIHSGAGSTCREIHSDAVSTGPEIHSGVGIGTNTLLSTGGTEDSQSNAETLVNGESTNTENGDMLEKVNQSLCSDLSDNISNGVPSKSNESCIQPAQCPSDPSEKSCDEPRLPNGEAGEPLTEIATLNNAENGDELNSRLVGGDNQTLMRSPNTESKDSTGADSSPPSEEKVCEEKISRRCSKSSRVGTQRLAGACDLETCLTAFFDPEYLTGANAYGCEKCTATENERIKRENEQREREREADGKKHVRFAVSDSESESLGPLVRREAVKRYSISKAPQVLTIHLKRFAQHSPRNLSKSSKDIRFPSVLDISELCTPFPETPEHTSRKYRLY
eukprot:457663_1